MHIEIILTFDAQKFFYFFVSFDYRILLGDWYSLMGTDDNSRLDIY